MIARSPSSNPRFSALSFYGLIVAGVALGVAVSCICGWLHLRSSNHAKATAIRIWEDSADAFIIPICAMIGGTFGGVLGVGLAVLFHSRIQTNSRKY